MILRAGLLVLPGDILLTGTPANSRPLEAGDTIEVRVTGRVALGNEERSPDKFETTA